MAGMLRVKLIKQYHYSIQIIMLTAQIFQKNSSRVANIIITFKVYVKSNIYS